jgi:hypothetical protein
MAIPSDIQSETSLPAAAQERAIERAARVRRILWRGRLGPAFWTIASLLSLVVNLILIAVLIGLGRQVFTLKGLIADPLIGGLHSNFVKMDNAHIVTNIQVKETIQVVDTIPVVFDLPLNTRTTVTLVEDTPIDNVTIYLNNSAVSLPLILPEGTPLKIRLNLTVPVSQTIPVTLNVPVELNVPVDIPLNQTELHEPFVGLRQVVEPYQTLTSGLPQTWQDAPFCGPWSNWLCRLMFE